MKNNENSTMCKSCGGRCCKFMGCHLSPKDIFGDKKPSIEILYKFLEKGIYAIDYWEGDPRKEFYELNIACYVRMKNKNSESLIDPSFGGECQVLTSSGCPFSFEERPLGGKALVPNESECISTYTKQECAIEWIPYHKWLLDISNSDYVRNNDGTITFKKEP